VDEVRHYVTTAEPWNSRSTPDGAAVRPKPPVTLNIGFTWYGLLALQLPTATLRLMPDEFIDGMACRNHILGDLGPSDPANWDSVWDPGRCEGRRVHMLISLNAQADDRKNGDVVDDLAAWTAWLEQLADRADGKVVLLKGHGPDGARYQDSNALMDIVDGTKTPTAREHFGFLDGISDPVFVGQSDNPKDAVGVGKLMPGPYDEASSWRPLATGEFILGHPSEGQELPEASVPAAFTHNGTFMAVRKLHQNVRSFRQVIDAQAEAYGAVAGLGDEEEARQTLMAKMVGRWASGVPLIVAPTWAEHQALLARFPALAKLQRRKTLDPGELRQVDDYKRMLVAFRYGGDPEGVKCPVSAHVRRSNPRDMLDPEPGPGGGATTLTNRRRILRRGLPYGETTDDDTGEHGVFIMAICTSLFRQFEFIQQQWMHYGLDFDVGNDSCPIIGNREPSRKYVIAADPTGDRAPFILADLPQFVETRGGEYFFLPGLTALRMIAAGTIDPT
jgi:Dyp-type peroxidase family